MTKNDIVNALAKQLYVAQSMNSPHDQTAIYVINSLAMELKIVDEVDSAYENYEPTCVE